MSNEENVNQRSARSKAAALTANERKLLMNLVNLHYDVLNNKVTNQATLKEKRQAWETIHKTYLESTKLKQPRTLKQLQRWWENTKGRAKKGERDAAKLTQNGAGHDSLQNEKNCTSKELVNGSTISMDGEGKESDAAPIFEISDHEPKDKPEEIQNSSRQSLDESILKIKEALNNNKCTHCGCEKTEKNAKAQLMILENHSNKELLQLEMCLIKERLENERELHKLHVREMSLKIENERKRAEILNKELGNYSESC